MTHSTEMGNIRYEARLPALLALTRPEDALLRPAICEVCPAPGSGVSSSLEVPKRILTYGTVAIVGGAGGPVLEINPV